jgi:hypothetical protein
MQEKKMGLNMQRIMSRMDHPRSLVQAAGEKQPYRDESEIRNLFRRLGITVKQLRALSNCYMVQLEI